MNRFKNRVLLAKDVIQQIEEKKVLIGTGTFLRNVPLGASGENAKRVFETYKERFGYPPPPCKACAKGTLFLAYIHRFNKVSYDTLILTDHYNVHNTELSKVFSKSMLDEIEILFERFPKNYFFENGRGSDKGWALTQYSKEHLYDNQTERLIQIMKLVIKNEGSKVVWPIAQRTK